MRVAPKALKLLTIASFLYTSPVANAQERCEADLGRVDTAFCLSDSHKESSGNGDLSYNWKLDDSSYDLTSNVCIRSGDVTGGDKRQDLIIAIDRSQNIWGSDSSSKKLGADNISATYRIIDKLRSEAQVNPANANKLGLILFSSKGNCQEFNGGEIYSDITFPCLFVKAKLMSDANHIDRLKSFLAAAEGLYSEGGLSSTSDYGIISNALKLNKLGLSGDQSAGLLIMSDGRTYSGTNGDTYAYLKSQNYLAAQNTAVKSFSSVDMQRYSLVFSLNPLKDPVLGNTHIDAMDNMCDLSQATNVDCNQNISINNPSQWEVNKIDANAFARRLVQTLGGTAEYVITLNDQSDIDAGLEILRYGNGKAPIDSVSYSINGANYILGKVSGSKIKLGNLPANRTLDLEILITSRGNKIKFPLKLSTEVVKRNKSEFRDKEMLCKDKIKTQTEDPENYLKKLQGGSASCGVIAGKDIAKFSMLLFFLPLFWVVFVMLQSNRKSKLQINLIIVLFAVLGMNSQADAGEGKGINALQYRPVNNGVGNAETAITTSKNSLNAGLYMDYSNDVLEIGGDKNKREQSIMDDLVTAHAVFNYGLLKDLSIGTHIPYVQKTDLERSVSTSNKSGGDVGQLSDVSLFAKYNFKKGRGLSIAAMPVITLPTGNPELLLGDGTANVGAMVLFSGINGRLSWAYNVGYMQRQKALVLSDDRTSDLIVRGQFVNISGVEYKLPILNLSLAANVQAKFSAGEGLDFGRSSPAEWSTSVKFKFASDYVLQSGFGTGIGKGFGSPDYRVWAGFSWVPQARRSRAIARR